jgi:myxalamid-type polyketide synthase MxaE and MxaD
MRAILFRLVDFSRCQAVLDFGCGYASDLVALAERYPHLQLLHGYTISSQQAQVGMDKVRVHQLQDRVQIYNRDSAVDEYPSQYDLVFGFEVAHHILDKTALFANIGQHINEQGYLVLADFISNTEFAIEHYESSSFFITCGEWVEHLSSNQLRVMECIDISREVANFLYDPNFEAHLDLIYQINHDDNVREGFRSYNQLGGLLRKGLASYVLLTAQKQSSLTGEELRQWNRQHLQKLVSYSLRSPQQWLYKLNWVSSSLANTSHLAPGRWLIFADQYGVAEQLAAELEAAGHTSILVYRGEHCEQIQENQWRIRLAEWQDYQQVLTAGSQSWQGIVHLWSLDSQDIDDLRASDLLEAQHLGCRSVLLLVQALAKLQDDAVCSGLWLITRGAQAGEDSSASVQVQQASLWGLGRVIGVEYPEWSCHLFDLDPQDSAAQQAQQLQQELITADAETQVRYQQGQRYAARFQRVWYPQTSEPLPVNENSTYLITGGLGALGLQLSQWLVEQGAKHLVLTARRSATEAAQVVLDRLQQQGVQIRVVLADITQAVDVERIFQELSVSMPPLKGVIHAAGTLEDGLLLQQNWERFEKVMAPKILGSWFLHQHTRTLPLDFFVCFSSVAALLGSAGQGNYAAANAFMDALAHYRRGQALAGLSLNWGPWAELGMAARLDQQQQETMAAAGMGLIPVAKGVDIFGDLLRTGQGPQLAVLAMDWGKALPSSVPPLFSDLGLGTREAIASDSLQTEKNDLLSSLQQATGVARQELLVSYLQQTTATVLGFASDQILDPLLGFFDMGIDSLLAVELRNRLQRDLEIRLASTLLFKYPTIQDLAEYLASQLDPVAHRSEEEPSVSSSSSATADSTETTLEQELLALQDLLRSDS